MDREGDEEDAGHAAMALETTGVTGDNANNEIALLDEDIADIERKI